VDPTRAAWWRAHCHYQFQSGLQGLASWSSQFCFLPTSFWHQQWYWLYPCSHWRPPWLRHQQSRVGFCHFQQWWTYPTGSWSTPGVYEQHQDGVGSCQECLEGSQGYESPTCDHCCHGLHGHSLQDPVRYLPGKWFDLRVAHPTTKVIWVFVPSHSGVTCNETAEMLDSSCSNFTPLNLFPSDLKLMGTKSRKDQLITPIQFWEEGRRLISLGSSLFSTRAGRAKAIYNQLLIGNISYSTLLMLLGGGRVDGERISAAAHPQCTLFATAKAKHLRFKVRSMGWPTISLFQSGMASVVNTKSRNFSNIQQICKISVKSQKYFFRCWVGNFDLVYLVISFNALFDINCSLELFSGKFPEK